MTRRHDSLLPLTHDHHHALRNARMLRLAADGDLSARTEAVEAFVHFFRTESVGHFREEEEVIFPLVALSERAPTAGIERVLKEHVVMHALVRELEAQEGDPSSEIMRTLAELLRAHVRFEEDELFPEIEKLAADKLRGVSLAPRDRTARDR
jgi:hemerythrin-like domain-containing protein